MVRVPCCCSQSTPFPFFDMVRLLMSLIGKINSSIVISFVQKSRTIPSSFMVLHPRMRSYTGTVIFPCHTLQHLVLPYTSCCLSIQRISTDFAPSFSEEVCIRGTPRIWYLPSQVGKMHGCSFFMDHQVTIRSTIYKNLDDCVSGATSDRVFESLFGLILSCLLVPSLG